MEGLERVKVLFIAWFGPIVRDVAASRELYGGVLSIPFKEDDAVTFTRGSARGKELRFMAALSRGSVLFWL